MRLTLVAILLSLAFKSVGQTTFIDFSTGCAEGLNRLKDSMTKIEFKHFKTLIARRDTQLLKKRMNDIPASIIYIIEGYNFKKNKYGRYEEYRLPPGKSIVEYPYKYLNNTDKTLPWITSFFIDTTWLSSSPYNIVPLYPRKYQYGTGCILSEEKTAIINELRKKAEQDGVVTEPYCRIETIIFLKEKKVIYQYLVPKPGKRDTYVVGGDGTEWPAGLDYWLFPNPYLTGD